MPARSRSRLCALLLCLSLAPGGCESAPTAETPDAASPEKPGSVVIIIVDDFGVDSALPYADADHDGAPDDGRRYGPTPHLSALCRSGVRFTRAWSAPTCSPTRATIFTGRHGFRTGVGTVVEGPSGALRPDEPALPKIAAAALGGQLATAGIGKWHLGTSAALGGARAPNTMGFAHYAGSLQGALSSYTSWQKTVNGQTAATTRYATTDAIDDAITWLAGPAQGKQFLLWLALNAPHTPLHLPPMGLHGSTQLSGTPADISAQPLPYYFAMIEAMDREIGRLLTWLKDHGRADATILFVGDNGTAREVVQAPVLRAHGKDSLYQGGIHVPLCVAGPAVASAGRQVDALVHTVDLYATTLALLGADPARAVPAGTKVDSVSLLPYLRDPATPSLRQTVMTETFGGMLVSGKAIRDARYKLLRIESGVGGPRDELYDLSGDPQETRDLLTAGPLSAEASERQQALRAALEQLLASQ